MRKRPKLFAKASPMDSEFVHFQAVNGAYVHGACIERIARYTGYSPPKDGSREEVEIIIRPVKKRPKAKR